MILSLFLILLSGIAVGTLCERLRVPALIAYLALGLLFGATGVLDEALLAISAEIRRAALVIILLRAGLSTRFSELKKSGSAAVLLCFLPALAEMCAVGLIAPLLFPLDGTEAFLLGSVLAAVSPAVVVPRMLSLSERGLGAEHAVPQTLTAGASADDIFVVLMFGIFLSAAKGGGFSLASLWQLPVSVLCGVAAGMLAQRMGLPVGGFVAASNLNDVVPEFLHTGVYRPRPSVQTPASAMDVGAPSNFERMLWLCGGDPERLRSELEGFRCDNAGIRRTIDELYERYGYFSDPHSAVGYAASMAVGKPGFYLSTAHPAKFGEVIASVTGSRVPLPERLSVLTQRPQHSDPLAVDLAALEDFVAEV